MRGRGRRFARACSNAGLAQGLDAGQDGRLLVQSATAHLGPPGVEPRQVMNRLTDEERGARGDLLAQPDHLHLDGIGVGRGHGAEAEIFRPGNGPFANQRTVAGQVGAGLQAIG